MQVVSVLIGLVVLGASVIVGAFVIAAAVGLGLILALIIYGRAWWLTRKAAGDESRSGVIEAEYRVVRAETRQDPASRDKDPGTGA